MLPQRDEDLLDASASRKALFAFLVSGLLTSFPGAILPAWGYHLRSDYDLIGYFFLATTIGILLSIRASALLLPRKGLSFTLAFACSLACATFAGLALAAPPSPDVVRIGAFVVLGFADGMLNTAIFHAISTIYQQNPAATINLAGAFFGFGCLLAALLLAGAFNVYNVPSILFLVAIIPAFFAFALGRTPFPKPNRLRQRTFQQVAREFRSPIAILFSLLLFFQFANEWSIAGWLPLFLIQRLGISPGKALLLLAVYWSALWIGRVVAQWILPKAGHGRILMSSVLAALLGCTVLGVTNNVFGACVGVILVGFGFSVVYPLVVEMIGVRFPHYHPGVFNGIFSFALTGGMLAPWLMGFVADAWGLQSVMAFPMIGTFAVLLLLFVIWVEAKLTGLSRQREVL